MIKVLGQDTILTPLRNQHFRGQLHHSLFFQGEPGVGKLETALWFAQGLFCENRPTIDSSNEIACGHCRSCLKVEFFQHPHILSLTVGDRIPAITYWRQALLNLAESAKEPLFPVRVQLGRDLSQLLSRHRQRLLDLVTKDKVTYREGVKLNAEDLEKLIYKIHLRYQDLIHPQKHLPLSSALDHQDFLNDMRILQNSLDRSSLSKENLDRVMAWCRHNDGQEKLVIVENIEKINSSVVGLFLKILEDPPPKVSFILITEEGDNINREVTLPLLSRCLDFSFSPLTGHIDEILRRKFHIETGFIHHQRNFQMFFQKQFAEETPVLEFLLQPTYQIMDRIQDPNFKENEMVSQLYRTLEEYPQNPLKQNQLVKMNFRQAYSILNFINQNYPLVKKNNYSKVYFMVELSLFTKKILKQPFPKEVSSSQERQS